MGQKNNNNIVIKKQQRSNISSIIKNNIYNALMNNGKKSITEKLFFKSIKFLQKFEVKNHKKILQSAILNASPIICNKKIKKKNKKKASTTFPYVIKQKRRLIIGIKSLINKVQPSKIDSYKRLSSEYILACKNTGHITKKVKEIHEQAFQKKKYARFRWF